MKGQYPVHRAYRREGGMMKSLEDKMAEILEEYGSDGCIEIIHHLHSVAHQECTVKHSTIREHKDWELISDAMDSAENVLDEWSPK